MNKEKDTMSMYIDPLTKFGFSRIFDNPANKDLLIAFLNAVFRGQKKIKDVSYGLDMHLENINFDRELFFGVTCTDENDELFIVPVQFSGEQHWKDSSLFHTCCLVNDQFKNQDIDDPGSQFTKVHMVSLLDNNIVDGFASGGYINDVYFGDRRTAAMVVDSITFVYISFSNFVKPDSALETELEKWLYVLKNISKMDKLPVSLQQPIFEKLFHIAEYANLTTDEQMIYDRDLKYKQVLPS